MDRTWNHLDAGINVWGVNICVRIDNTGLNECAQGESEMMHLYLKRNKKEPLKETERSQYRGKLSLGEL